MSTSCSVFELKFGAFFVSHFALNVPLGQFPSCLSGFLPFCFRHFVCFGKIIVCVQLYN